MKFKGYDVELSLGHVIDYKKLMDGIYSTSICEATLDEAPMAYKNADDIVKDLGETASLIKVIKPIYNFKDHSKKRSEK